MLSFLPVSVSYLRYSSICDILFQAVQKVSHPHVPFDIPRHT